MRIRLIKGAALAALGTALVAGAIVLTRPEVYTPPPGGPIPASASGALHCRHHNGVTWCPNLPASAPRSIIGDVSLASYDSIIGDPSKDIAGYSTGRWVRTMSATFNLPSNTQCAQQFETRSPEGDGFAITLGPAEESNAGVPFSAGAASTVGLSFVPSVSGCGLISPSFASNLPAYTGADQFPASPGNFLPGDNVTLQLFYNLTGHFTTGVVIDNTTGGSVHSTVDGKVTYVGGSATAGFGPFAPQGGKVKLWAPKSVTLKTYTNHAGSIGAFKPAEITMTSDGTSSGTQFANPGVLWDAGANFSVFAH